MEVADGEELWRFIEEAELKSEFQSTVILVIPYSLIPLDHRLLCRAEGDGGCGPRGAAGVY